MAVADEENISQAARRLGLSQPMVSRYLADLQRWAGKDLAVPGGLRDPEHPAISVALTEEGRAFYDLATKILSELTDFRTPQARAREQISQMKLYLAQLAADRDGPNPSAAVKRGAHSIGVLEGLVNVLDEATPLEALVVVQHEMRKFFMDYEADLKREKALKPKSHKAG